MLLPPCITGLDRSRSLQQQQLTGLPACCILLHLCNRYAIMDECTSAVSDDVTDKIYETCSSLGITLFTIAHQKTVIKHHKLILRFDGKGGWAIENVTPDSAMH